MNAGSVVPLTYEEWRQREENRFGDPDGIGRRCAMWANQLRRNKAFPWVGTGLVDDLECVARMHGIDSQAFYPSVVQTSPGELTYEMDPVEDEDEFAHWQPSPPDDVPTVERYPRPNDLPIEELYREPARPGDYDL